MYPELEPEAEPPVERQAPRVPQPGGSGNQQKPQKRSKHREKGHTTSVPVEPPVQQRQPVEVPASTQPVQGVKRAHPVLPTNPPATQPSPAPPPRSPVPSADKGHKESVPDQYTLPPLPAWEESSQSTKSGSPCKSTDWDMSSVDSHQSRWSVQASRAVNFKEPRPPDVPMYPAQRRKRGRPRKERKPLGYRHNQPLPQAPVAHSTRS